MLPYYWEALHILSVSHWLVCEAAFVLEDAALCPKLNQKPALKAYRECSASVRIPHAQQAAQQAAAAAQLSAHSQSHTDEQQSTDIERCDYSHLHYRRIAHRTSILRNFNNSGSASSRLPATEVSVAATAADSTHRTGQQTGPTATDRLTD